VLKRPGKEEMLPQSRKVATKELSFNVLSF